MRATAARRFIRAPTTMPIFSSTASVKLNSAAPSISSRGRMSTLFALSPVVAAHAHTSSIEEPGVTAAKDGREKCLTTNPHC